MKDFIKNLFRDVIENEHYDEKLIDQYFSNKYIQNVDNVILDYDTFKKHIQKLKSKVKKQQVDFENIVSDGNFVFTKHYVESILLNNETVKHKVIAEFTISDGKVVYCDELTLLVEGTINENNLGSEI